MTDDWRSVEERLYWIDQLLRWRPIVAAMRRLIAAIKADPRFHDLRPSMSHAALVFRRGADHAVCASWNPEDEMYKVAFIDPGFTFRDSRAAATDAILDLLFDYLDRSPLNESSAVTTYATDERRAHEWEEVEAEYRRIAEHYPSEAAFVAAMASLVAAIRTDARFGDVDPRRARGDSRAGGPLGSLVFRLLARRSVWAWWDETEATYHGALIEGDVMLQHAQSARLADVVELLLGYLEQASP